MTRPNGLTGRLELSDRLSRTVPKDATVEIAAYAVDGPRLPVARKVLPAARWPIEFSLTDADAVNPAFALSKAVQVVLVARVVRPQADRPAHDGLEGRSTPVPSGDSGVIVLVDRRPPRS